MVNVFCPFGPRDPQHRIPRPRKCRISIQKPEISYSKRKRLQIDHAPNLSKEATLVKIADKISNVTDIIHEQPFDWDDNRCKDYIEWAESVINNCQKVNRNLENHFFNLVNSYHL